MAEPQWLPTPQEQQLVADDIGLPVGYCMACHKEVVAHARLGEGQRRGALVWCCIFCDDELLQEEGGLKPTPAGELAERGYRVVAPEAARLHKEGGSSDAGGCGTCSKGGCST